MTTRHFISINMYIDRYAQTICARGLAVANMLESFGE